MQQAARRAGAARRRQVMQRGGGRSRRLQVSSCHQHGAVRMQRGGAPVRAGVGRVPQSPRARRRRPEWPACRAGLRRAAKEARAACCVCVRAIYECEEKVAGRMLIFYRVRVCLVSACAPK